MRGWCYTRQLQQWVAIIGARPHRVQSGEQTVPTGPAIARETGGGQLRYNSLRRLSVTERLIHSFGAAGLDGYYPQAALLVCQWHVLRNHGKRQWR